MKLIRQIIRRNIRLKEVHKTDPSTNQSCRGDWISVPHAHLIPMEKPVGIPTKSPYSVSPSTKPRNLSYALHTPGVFSLGIFASLLCRPILSVYLVCTVLSYCVMYQMYNTDRQWSFRKTGTSGNWCLGPSTKGVLLRVSGNITPENI